MKRSEMREQAFLLCFESLFSDTDTKDIIALYNENFDEVCTYARDILEGINADKEALDGIINTYSKSWKASRLPKTTLAILYVAIYEMQNVESVPDSVAINEAVELAKKYSGTDDASYINGVLGGFARSRE
jgi:N utilization substance protein B